jgi:hypothetical protein
MRTVTFDAGFTWDDPNLRWGDPSYLLEPGDPGYVSPLPTNLEPPTKTNRMRRNNYYPLRQADQILWLGNFANKLTAYTTTLGLTAGQVTAIIADCNWLIYVLQTWLPAARNWALAGTDAATEAQTGTGVTALVLPVFTAPALPAGVVAVNPGALNRIFALAQIIKDSGKSTEAINTNLGLVGSAQTAPDVATLKPALAATISGTQVNVKWGWGGNSAFLDSCEIQVDRGTGFGLLTIDTTPNYTDTQAFPAAGQTALWKYKAIYRQGDDRVGQWSDVVSIPVAG